MDYIGTVNTPDVVHWAPMYTWFTVGVLVLLLGLGLWLSFVASDPDERVFHMVAVGVLGVAAIGIAAAIVSTGVGLADTEREHAAAMNRFEHQYNYRVLDYNARYFEEFTATGHGQSVIGRIVEVDGRFYFLALKE